MEVSMEISVGKAVRCELAREKVKALQGAKTELSEVIPIVEFICYDIGIPDFRNLEAYVSLNIGAKKYYVDLWAVKADEDVIKKMKELLPDVTERAPWEQAKADLLTEMLQEET